MTNFDVNRLANAEGTFNYSDLDSFASRYLATYYKAIDPDELEVSKFIVREYTKIKNKPIFLDIGAGPTIHHTLPVVPYVTGIDVADYLFDNLDQIAKWRDKHLKMHDWNHFTKKILELEGEAITEDLIVEREEKLREMIHELSHCNILKKDPLGSTKHYDAIGFFYCAEEVALTKKAWRNVMQNVCNILNPGGYLFMSALRETDYYTIVKDDNEIEKLPTARLNEKDFYDLLPKLNFDMSQTVIEVADTPAQKDHGISSIILISARKMK